MASTLRFATSGVGVEPDDLTVLGVEVGGGRAVGAPPVRGVFYTSSYTLADVYGGVGTGFQGFRPKACSYSLVTLKIGKTAP